MPSSPRKCRSPRKAAVGLKKTLCDIHNLHPLKKRKRKQSSMASKDVTMPNAGKAEPSVPSSSEETPEATPAQEAPIAAASPLAYSPTKEPPLKAPRWTQASPAKAAWRDEGAFFRSPDTARLRPLRRSISSSAVRNLALLHPSPLKAAGSQPPPPPEEEDVDEDPEEPTEAFPEARARAVSNNNFLRLNLRKKNYTKGTPKQTGAQFKRKQWKKFSKFQRH